MNNFKDLKLPTGFIAGILMIISLIQAYVIFDKNSDKEILMNSVQQQIQYDMEQARNVYTEIYDALNDEKENYRDVILALSKIPEAMRASVSQIETTENGYNVIKKYPNFKPLKELLINFSKKDRTLLAILNNKLGTIDKLGELKSGILDKIGFLLEPVSTSIVLTLYRLGPPESEIATAENCLWLFDVESGEGIPEARPYPTKYYNFEHQSYKQKIDLTHIEPSFFVGIHIPFARIQGTIFPEKVNFTDAYMYRVHLPAAVMTGALLSNTILSEATLRGAFINSASGAYISFLEADLEDVNFSGSFLTSLDFSKANLRGAKFDRAAMIFACFEGVKNFTDKQYRSIETSNYPETPIEEQIAMGLPQIPEECQPNFVE